MAVYFDGVGMTQADEYKKRIFIIVMGAWLFGLVGMGFVFLGWKTLGTLIVLLSIGVGVVNIARGMLAIISGNSRY
jgi:hypothetical protein